MGIDWIEYARRWTPQSVRYFAQRFISLDKLKMHWRATRDPLACVTEGAGTESGPSIRLAILKNRAQYHLHYVRACQELGIAFRVLDIAQDNWLSAVASSGCQACLAWPDATLRHVAKLYKDRCDLIENKFGIPVIPNAQERWLYEDKFRQRDWLQVNNVLHPSTWLFTDQQTAEEFAEACALPIVCKTSFGGGATGVRIVKKRRRLKALIRRAFRHGLCPNGHDHRDREWGRILLQEYLPLIREWRMVRIGDSYFGHPKGTKGDFHSGSGRVNWDVPNDRLLDLLHEVTELGQFRSMNVDVFETTNGRYLVNELQAVFGASTSIDQMRVDGKAGRMIRSPDGRWEFEAGDFARNACANERITYLMKMLFDSIANGSSS